MGNSKNVDYYVGVDIGTNSVGWAVTDENYRILYHKKKAMWGTRLFDEAITAENRRLSRANRRRLGRKRWRIELLQELFAEEICKADASFYQRIKDSMLWPEDKTEAQKYSLFNDPDYNDADFYREFPTIYHLRKALLTEDRKWDIRMVYIAIHHLIKHRGHFLFNGSVEKATSFANVYEGFKNCMSDELGIELECLSEQDLENVLKDERLSRKEKNAKVMQILQCGKSDKQLKAAIGLVCGLKVKMADLFADESLKDMEKPSISLAEGEYEATRAAVEPDLMERCAVLDIVKTMYDWSVLADILADGDYNGNSYLSVAKVNKYEKHKKDLALLKRVIAETGRENYRNFFRKEGVANYCAYIGYTIINGKKQKVKRCKYEDLQKEIKNILTKNVPDLPETAEILEELEKGSFLPLQVTKDNGVIPYQVNEMELKNILKKVEAQFPFLKNADEKGITTEEKIIKIFKFRVPYFVGPLNPYQNKNAWAVRKESGVITPWNLEEKVDFEKSGEKFIRRMTNKCTYLAGKDVISKNSLLYCEYMVWNEINNIRIGGEKISVELKDKLFETLYKNRKNVRIRDIKEFLLSEGIDLKTQELSGVDTTLKANLGSYHDFRKIFGDEIKKYDTQKMAEKIINWLTVYSSDEKMLKRVIRKEYAESAISDKQLAKVVRLRYQGWGRLSAEFLCGIEGTDTETGETGTILYMLRNTNDNLMQLLSSRYTFLENIERENSFSENNNSSFSYENLLEDVVASPAIKRAVWQTMLIIKEVKKIMGKEPKKIFIEMARAEGEKKRTVSRKDQLKELYKSIKDTERDWIKEIDSRDESEFRSIRLYLYYTQMGKCMYSGEPIDLASLMDANVYDRDHIYPQSKTKDDSLDNMVLVKRTLNATKSNDMISPAIQDKMYIFWKGLKEKGLISGKKYERLMRKTPLTEEELAGFINRQLVETRQSTKLTAKLLQQCFPESSIVYVKAGVASQLRKDPLEMVKSRTVNDYHHAKDAYLNIVAGNVYYEKFTNNPLKWLRQSKGEKYSLNRMYDFDIVRNEQIIWQAGKTGSVQIVREQMLKNDIQYTRYATTNKHGQNGGFFNQMPVSRDEKPGVPLKKHLPVERYGGYKSLTPAYFALVESDGKKGEKVRTIEAVPLYKAARFEKGEERFEDYCEEYYGLKNAKVILPKIKKDSLLVVNGFPMHLRGTTGKQLKMQNAVQLVLPEPEVAYVKKIEKYIVRKTEFKGKELLPIREWDGITKEENTILYDTLCGKLLHTIYKYRPNNQGEKLVQERERFVALSVEEQCVLLNEILWFFRCKPQTYADLKLLGGSAISGDIKISKKVSSTESFYLLHPSVTGLFEQKINLLTCL